MHVLATSLQMEKVWFFINYQIETEFLFYMY